MQSLWMLYASFIFAIMGVCVKLASATSSTSEIVLARGAVGMTVLFVLARARGLSLKTIYPWQHAWRGFVGVTALWLWFFAIGRLPLATAMTLNYMAPIWIAAIVFTLGWWHKQRHFEWGLAAAIVTSFAGVALLLLTVLLVRQRWLTASARRFTLIRIAFLSFTLGFIGWYAQGQLSIVNITGFLQSIKDGRSLAFFLYDPMTVSLWAFITITFFVWGRATFCGWLCPFGALQELVSRLARLLRVPQVRLRTALDAKLKWIKYVLLAALIVSALFAPQLADSLAEIEPFKTSITLYFVRSWPFVLYAAGLVIASAFVYKFFCRYLCPFGAGLAVLGRLRLFKWLPRRSECGTPCQTCRHRCDYQAIRPDGAIVYHECFQCMDCVVIYHSDTQCAPRILQAKRGKTIPLRVVNPKEAA